jgi:hypothetical protein
MVNDGNNYNVGEMAHVIGQSPSGPRGNGAGGPDSYDNLILLCPTCHREIDKAPAGLFPENLLNSWKKQHEERIRKIDLEQCYSTMDELVKAVGALLAENYMIWKDLTRIIHESHRR